MDRIGTQREEFERLVDHYHRDLVRFGYAMCGDREMAEDAAQQCWEAAWRHRQDLRDPNRVRGWLFTITANNLRRQLRRRRLAKLLGGRVAPPRSPDIDGRSMELIAALEALPFRDREIIAMKYEAGMSSEEIGAALGLSGSGIRRRLQTVMTTLREELRDA